MTTGRAAFRREANTASPSGPVGPRRAFTLIEMLVVLLIIAVVLALAAGVATSLFMRADKAETISRLKIVWEAIAAYFDERQEWPNSLNDLAGVEKCRAVLRRLPEECMTAIDQDSLVIKDRYDNNLQYSLSGGFGGEPILYSMGPDGRDNSKVDKKDNIYKHEN